MRVQALLKLKTKMRKEAAVAREEAEARDAELDLAAAAMLGSGQGRHANFTAGASGEHLTASSLASTLPDGADTAESGYDIRQRAGQASIPAQGLGAVGDINTASPSRHPFLHLPNLLWSQSWELISLAVSSLWSDSNAAHQPQMQPSDGHQALKGKAAKRCPFDLSYRPLGYLSSQESQLFSGSRPDRTQNRLSGTDPTMIV